MKIICAPDSFKESLSACEVAEAMAKGIKQANEQIEIDICPMADGGEGTLKTLVTASGGEIRHVKVTDPLEKPVNANWGILGKGKTAIIEMAEASGLALIPQESRNPTMTTSFGTGELIKHAIENHCSELIVAIGGSATVDGGAGALQALGFKFINHNGNEITDFMTGGRLLKVNEIQPPDNLTDFPKIRIACDVKNPLLGESGAAVIYGPQKGATPKQVKILEHGLGNLADIAQLDTLIPGTGAAGGIGYGFMAFLNATIEDGVTLVLEAVNFNDRLKSANLVLTGEGCLDSQSLEGKTTMGVANAAAEKNVKSIAIAGRTGEGAANCVGNVSEGLLDSFVSLTDRFGLEKSMNETATCIETVAFEIASDLMNGK